MLNAIAPRRAGSLPLAALFFAFAAGCDHPTAPQARDAVESAQHKIFDGNLGTINAQLGLILQQTTDQRALQRTRLPHGGIVADRNGGLVELQATVIERVYLPPADNGGRPYIRRSVLAWDVDTRRSIVLMSDDAASDVVPPTMDRLNGAKRLFTRSGFVLHTEPGEKQPWFGRDGRLEIKDGTPTGGCPLDSRYVAGETGLATEAPSSDVTCEAVRYPVSLWTTLEKGDPNARSAVEQAFAQHPTLRIDEQLVPGLRIVTQCTDTNALRLEGCSNPMAFWRDNAQFAAPLGVDVSQLRGSSGVFWQRLAPGTGRAYSDVPVWPTGPVRYTISTPAGRILTQGVFAAAESNDAGVLGEIVREQSGGPLRPGYRARVVGPARLFGLHGDAFAIGVLEFELLPPSP